MEGFTFNGIHCSEYGVFYIPDAADRWRQNADFESYTKDVSWKNGGYYYGSAEKIRTMELKCYYEEISIATREKIRKWLMHGTRGKLVFDNMPFVYYNAIPDNVVPGNLYLDNNGTYSGTFNVKFVFENPFGIMTRKSNTGSEDDNAEEYCGIIASSMMPSAPSVSATAFDVYNPGTQPCGLSIMVSGSASNPIRFFNPRNKTQCVISSLPENDLILDINGETGYVKTYIAQMENNSENGYAFHDYGVVRLEPDTTDFGIAFTASQNGNVYDVQTNDIILNDSYIGAYVRLHGSTAVSAKVISVSPNTGTMQCSPVGSATLPASGSMDISTVNNIVIEEKTSGGGWETPTSLSMTSIAVDYTPCVM